MDKRPELLLDGEWLRDVGIPARDEMTGPLVNALLGAVYTHEPQMVLAAKEHGAMKYTIHGIKAPFVCKYCQRKALGYLHVGSGYSVQYELKYTEKQWSLTCRWG